MNTGDVVPNGTKFTVYTLAPDTVTLAPLGTILTPDADPLTDGVQVVSQDGAFQFTATFPPGVKVPLVVGFATRGTAFGGQVIRLQ
jgi:hypothetical protein